ncbi:MAG TPA: MFS transporter, partial [Conexibacter sp.]
VNLPLGALALVGLRLRLPASRHDRPRQPVDALGAALLAAATSAFMLVCVWGGDRYAWGSPRLLGLCGAVVALGVALAAWERRAADPIVPLGLLRTRPVALASAALFLTTGALFSVNVFVPLFLQTTTGASPLQAGLLLVPMMIGITISTNLAGRAIARSGRYKRYPVGGLALMTAALALLALVAGDPSRTTIALGGALFGLGFGTVGQVLVVAVQNSVERAQLGVAMATTNFFRGLGGAVGAAALGAIFAARAGLAAGEGAVHGLAPAARADVIDAVQTVFLATAPVAALALLLVLALEEVPLGDGRPGRAAPPARGGAAVAPQRG